MESVVVNADYVLLLPLLTQSSSLPPAQAVARSSMSAADVQAGSSTSGSMVALTSINRVVLHLLKQRVQDSQDRQGRSLSTLQQALASLKVCPVLFSQVDELKQLYGFESDVLREELQRMLSEWCAKHGRRLPTASATVASRDDEAAQSMSKALCDSITPNATKKGARPKQADQQKAKKKTAAATTTTPKQYIPQPRSGTHGIMVALYSMTPAPPTEPEEERQAADTVSYHSKSAIITHAQPYCDTKYVPKQAPSHFSKGPVSFHSAWSGMKTLINRGYVYRRGNPALFGLSAVGWQVAEMCASKESVRAGCRSKYKEDAERAAWKGGGEEAGGAEGPSAKAGRKGKRRAEDATQSEVAPAPFLYAFLTDAVPVEVVTSRAQAHMRLSDTDFCLRLRVVFRASQAEHIFAVKCIESVEPYDGDPASLLVGWAKESVCNAEAPGLPVESAAKRRSLSPTSQDERSQQPQQATAISLVAKKKKREATLTKKSASTSVTVRTRKPKASSKRRASMSSDFLDTTCSSANEEGVDDDDVDVVPNGAAPLARVDNVIDERRTILKDTRKPSANQPVAMSAAIDPLGSSSDSEPLAQRRAFSRSAHLAAPLSKARMGAPQREPVWISSSDVDGQDILRSDDLPASPSRLASHARSRGQLKRL